MDVSEIGIYELYTDYIEIGIYELYRGYILLYKDDGKEN